MRPPIQPGARGEPLPADEDAFRLIRASKDGKVSEASFTLSEEDKQSALQSLSVFALRLTVPAQALALMESEKQAVYGLYALLGVAAVRALRPSPDSPDVPSLDVVWDPLPAFPDSQAAGAEGHAGITGLLGPTGLTDAKILYKSLRSQLADLANQRLSPIARLSDAVHEQS